MILVDPRAQRILSNENVISKAGWTPFDGRKVSGEVVQTYLRGNLIAESGKPMDDRTGVFQHGAGKM
ncbi:MAG: hypothetical protein PVSMB10_09250 [Pseudarthrobacter sp.]